jgi:hypothetical protein
MLEIVQAHKDANEADLIATVKNSYNVSEKAEILAQLKGQVFAFEQMLEIKEYLNQAIQEEAEDNNQEVNHEVSSFRSSSPIKSS